MSERIASNKQELSLDVPSILSDLKRNILPILLCAFAMAMLGYAYTTMTHKDIYTASEVLVVTSDRSELSSAGAKSVDQLKTLFSDLLKGDILRRKVQQDIGAINYTLATSFTGDTNIMSLSVSSDSPENAFRALQSVMRNYPLLTDQLLSDVFLITLQKPSVTTSPVNPNNYKTAVVLAFVLGGLLCIAAVTLLSVLRDTVKNEQDVRNKVDATLLGVIPIEKLIGAPRKDYFLINNPALPMQYAESYYMAVSRIMSRLERRNAQVLMVTSVTPNEGKSTAVINLAMALEKNQKKVLVVDGDFRNPSIAGILGIGSENDKQFSDALKKKRISDVKPIQPPNSTITYILNTKGTSHTSEYFGNGMFRRLLDNAKRNFDYILVDSGPVALVSDTEAIADLCDATLLIVNQDTALVQAINDTVDMLNRSESSFIGTLFKMKQPKRRGSGYGYGYGYGYGNGNDKQKKTQV